MRDIEFVPRLTPRPESKSYRLGDLFTEDEIARAAQLYARSGIGRFANDCVNEIITPEVHSRINEFTGQDNDRRYLAYVMEYALMSSPGGAR